MLELNLSTNRRPLTRVLCLGAHSDDIEIGCGGAVLALTERYPGLMVDWVVFSGNPLRQAEARASADAFFGCGRRKEIELYDFRDGYFPFEGALVKDRFEALKSRPQPDLIFTHRRDDRHQDHRLISDLTYNTFRNHLILEYEIPKYDGDLAAPNVFISLPMFAYQRKVELLMAHFATQRSRDWFTPETFLGLMRLRGVECRADSGYAEAFFCHKLVLA
ncbi:MAG: PIG-L family deacetylase [Anaerolineales bacterium]|nr:PIG-L family deacetylase [Anaerolineales bacterium]